MDDSDKKQFATLFYGLAEEYGGTITKNGARLKFEALKEYGIESIIRAANWIVKNREKAYPPVPTVKEFLDAIEIIENPKINGKTKSEMQCDIVLKYYGHYGRNCNHVFKDPTTRYLMENRWSFYRLDQESVKDPALKWFRKEFVAAYGDMDDSNIAILPGRSEQCQIPTEGLKKLTVCKDI